MISVKFCDKINMLDYHYSSVSEAYSPDEGVVTLCKPQKLAEGFIIPCWRNRIKIRVESLLKHAS